MRYRKSCLALVALLAAAPLAAQSLPDPRADGLSGAQRRAALVERVRLAQDEIETLETSFVQVQESELLMESEEAGGTFSFEAPDRVRWEYTYPNPITMIVDEDTMITWYRDLERAEKLKVGKYSSQVLKYLGAGSSIDSLLEYFDVRAAFPDDRSQPYRLELEPKFARVAKRLRSITIWIEPERFMPSRLRYVSGDGDSTEYRFGELRVNGELPADRFELELPESVEVLFLDAEEAGASRANRASE